MDAQALIRIYRMGFYICMAITIVGILLSALFFFRFHIGKIWLIQTGKAQRKAVQDMQEASRQNVRMRADPLESRLKETEVLVQTGQLIPTAVLDTDPAVTERFEELETLTITQEVILIHTDEKIV